MEDEISHLQKENSRIENQLSRMKGDVTNAETDASSDDKVDFLEIYLLSFDPIFATTLCISKQNNSILIFQDQSELKRKNAKLTDYYENLRSNVFSIFGSTQNYSDSYLGLFSNIDLTFPLYSNPSSRFQGHVEARGRHGEPGEVRQLPDQAAEHLHGAGRGARPRGQHQARLREHEVCNPEHVRLTRTNVITSSSVSSQVLLSISWTSSSNMSTAAVISCIIPALLLCKIFHD